MNRIKKKNSFLNFDGLGEYENIPGAYFSCIVIRAICWQWTNLRQNSINYDYLRIAL
jgi:hypothetical protein